MCLSLCACACVLQRSVGIVHHHAESILYKFRQIYMFFFLLKRSDCKFVENKKQRLFKGNIIGAFS